MFQKFIITLMGSIIILSSWCNNSSASSWYQHSSLKITVETEEILYEWEYENPSSFEFEKGDRIYRGEEAKKSFEEILKILDLSKDTIDESTVRLVENAGFHHVKRIAIYKIDHEQRYQTWVWNRK